MLPHLLQADPADDFHRITASQAHDADLDIRRAHKSAGRSRKEVDGAWSRLESAVWHTKGTWIVSMPAVHLAHSDQRQLAMDGLRGIKVQVVVVRTPDNADVVEAIAARWNQPLHPERLHVVDTDGSTEAAWRGLFDVAGLPSRALPSGAGPVAAGSAADGVLARVIDQRSGSTAVAAAAAQLLAGGDEAEDQPAAAARALAAAADELVHAEQRIRELLADNERLDRKRRKHKRRLRDLRAGLDPSPTELEHVTVRA